MFHINSYFNYDPSDCLTPEEEADIDARYAEQEVDDWLVAWSEDFWSDEWLAVTPVADAAGAPC